MKAVAIQTEDFDPASEPLEGRYRGEQPWKTLLGIYRAHWGQLIMSLFWLLLKSSPVWVMPLITANVIDIISRPGPDAMRALGLNAFFCAVIVCQNVPTHLMYARLVSKAMRSGEADLRSALVRRLQQLSISYHKTHSSGRLQAKVLRDVETVDQMSRTLMDAGIGAVFMTISALGVTCYRAPRFLPVFLVTVPIVLVLRTYLFGALKKPNNEFRLQVEGMSAYVIGMIEMIPTARAHAAEDAEIARMEEKVDGVKEAGLRLDFRNNLFGCVAWVSFSFFNMACLILGAWLSYTKIIPLTPGDVVMLASYFGLISNSILAIVTMMPIITKGFESVQSIGEVLECPDIEKNLGKRVVANVRGEFNFQSVNFTYPGGGRSSIIDFSLEVKPGETIGVVGASGSGKSTLMNLILGFVRPDSGAIVLDGQPMNAIDLRSYRRFVGVVSQESLLFRGSLRDNILHGTPRVSEERFHRVLEDANVLEFIEKLPRGVDSETGDRGATLSCGQKQRIAIARALIRNPRVLILDEATSALDVAFEAQVQTALVRLMKGRTTFIVAHRLSTVRNADRIVVLEDGRIAEIGPPEELLLRGGPYAKMVAMQQGALTV
jgi:ATP-binding cassette subfamily B protein